MKRILENNKKGFTLVEIMIVVGIIGMLVTMATSAFVRARSNSQKVMCLNNLRMIHLANTQHAIEFGKTNGDPVTESDLNGYLKQDFSDLAEPAGFAYIMGEIGKDPICTYGGTHVLSGEN